MLHCLSFFDMRDSDYIFGILKLFYNTVGTIPNSNRKIIETGKLDTIKTYI